MKLRHLIGILVVVGGLSFSAAAQNIYELDGNRLKVEKSITFVGATDKLEAASEGALKFVKDYLTDKRAISTLRIEVHFRVGTENAQALSEKRALAVANWLVKNGVDCKRLIAVGFGTTKPISDPPQAFENDRIEFHNAGMLGRQIGGMPLDGGGKSAGSICPTP